MLRCECAVIAQGTAPRTIGYVDGPDATTFAAAETGWFTIVPTIYQPDSALHARLLPTGTS
jgi:putative spermidine/putrescine transport system substrate-binding protein